MEPVLDLLGREVRPGDVIAVTRRDKYSGNHVAIVTRISYSKDPFTLGSKKRRVLKVGTPTRIYYTDHNWKKAVIERYNEVQEGKQGCIVKLAVDNSLTEAMQPVCQAAIADGLLPSNYKFGTAIEDLKESSGKVEDVALNGISLLRREE